MSAKPEIPIGTYSGQPHGSRSEDEMRARMRDVGYEDWEIEQEIAEAREAAELAKGKPVYYPQGRPSESFQIPIPMRGNNCKPDPAKREQEARGSAEVAVESAPKAQGKAVSR